MKGDIAIAIANAITFGRQQCCYSYCCVWKQMELHTDIKKNRDLSNLLVVDTKDTRPC